MGWTTYTSRQPIERLKDLWKGEILKWKVVDSVWYAALKQESGLVTGAIVLLEGYASNGTFIGYKDMGEEEGPYYYDCPKEVFELLSELPDTPEYRFAKVWREKCAANIALGLN